ncbi:hypothetical protein BDW71DRAFT_181758 [Aspergillus fruticulosus]
MLLLFCLILGALPAALCCMFLRPSEGSLVATDTSSLVRLELPSESTAIPTDSFTVSWQLDEDDDANGELEIFLEYLVIDGETNTLISTTSKVDATESSTVLPPSFLPAVRPSETMPIGMLMHAIKDGQLTDPHARNIFLVGRTQEPDTVTATAPATMAAGETATAGTNVALETAAPKNASEEVNEVQEDEAGSGGLLTGAKAGIGTGVGAGGNEIKGAALTSLPRSSYPAGNGRGVTLCQRYRRVKLPW